MHRVVIIGGGFGGLETARRLARAPVEVTVVDRRNFHLFQPLLYQVATGTLSGANIATPLRHLLRRQDNADVVLGEATGFDLAARRVHLAAGDLPYDTLVVAAGSQPAYFGHAGWAAAAPGLKTLEDAVAIRARVFRAFEEAELASDRERRAACLTFVVVGGGPTSVELAGQLSEISRHSLQGDFRHMDPRRARIVVIEADGRLLGQFSERSSRHAESSFAEIGVEVRLRTRVTAIDPDGVEIDGPGGRERIAARTVLWGAGVGASPLGALLVRAAGQEPARGGRVAVAADCTLPGHPEIFVIGDLAACEQDGRPLPGVAQVAIQQGAHAARVIAARLRGTAPPPFRYRDLGTMATIGKRRAVVEIGRLVLRGRIAWLMWLVLHLAKLVRAENRMLVLIQWTWYYFTWNRSAQLITGPVTESAECSPVAPE